MELRLHKTSHWTVPLAKVLLMQSVVISVSHAAALNDAPPATSTHVNITDARLAQLDLNDDT